MKRVDYFKFLILISFCCSLQSCDWMRSMLGMPTSADIEAMKREWLAEISENSKDSLRDNEVKDVIVPQEVIIKRYEAKDSAVINKDSAIQNIVVNNIDSTKLEIEEQKDYMYYIVLGCYRERSNVDKIKKKLISNGEVPVVFDRSNGTMLVCAGGADDISVARDNLKRINLLKLTSDALWIFENK